MGQQQCKWKSADAVVAAKFIRGIFGAPRVFADEAGGMAIWSQFSGKTLLSGAVVFNKVIVADMDSGYLWLMLPVAGLSTTAIGRLLVLDPRINYNRAGGNVIVCADTLGMAISLMRIAVCALGNAPLPAALNETNNVNDATSEYADLVLRLPAISREHYGTYDDGTASNMPGPLAAADNRNAKFYRDLDASGTYPFVANNDRSSVSIPSSRYNAGEIRPPRDAADRVINGRGELAKRSAAEVAIERMTQFDGRVSNDPLAVALTDDASELIYAQLDAAEGSALQTAPGQRAGRRLYEADPTQSGAGIRAQMLNAGYVGPVVATSGDPARFTASAWPGGAVLAASARPTASWTRPAATAQRSGVAPVRSAGASGQPVRNNSEGFASNAVRFQPSTAFIYYDVGSDTMDIDRTYGTVAADQRFPALGDVMYGYHSLPPAPADDASRKVSTNFKPVPVTENFHSAPDPFLASRAASS